MDQRQSDGGRQGLKIFVSIFLSDVCVHILEHVRGGDMTCLLPPAEEFRHHIKQPSRREILKLFSNNNYHLNII